MPCCRIMKWSDPIAQEHSHKGLEASVKTGSSIMGLFHCMVSPASEIVITRNHLEKVDSSLPWRQLNWTIYP